MSAAEWSEPLADLRSVIDAHVGVTIRIGEVRCHPCGALIYTPGEGLRYGSAKPGQAVAEAAHAAHLAYVIEAWRERQAWLEHQP